MELIRNKVAESGIITIDLETFIPGEDQIALFDLKPFLFRELILREKDYRAALAEYDWQQFAGKHVGIVCTADAIIPMWAFMLAAVYLEPVAVSLHYGPEEIIRNEVAAGKISALDNKEFEDKRIVLKGCGENPIPQAVYVAATAKLRPLAKSLMYGEPCSTVPIYKKTVTTKAENA